MDKVMDAATLYSQIKEYANLNDTTICHLHIPNNIPCIEDSNVKCLHPSKVKVLNFDLVKELYCGTLSSVDAITHKHQLIVFVEIKSVENIAKELRFDKRITKRIDSSTNKGEAVSAIANIKVKKLADSLKAKIQHSIEICKGIANDENLFNKIDFVYVLVTDVDTLSNPMQQFQAHLNELSYNAVKLKMESELKKEHISVGHRNRYARCKEFDKFME